MLEDENRRLKQQLEEEQEKNEMAEKYASPKRESTSKLSNGPSEMQLMEVQSKWAEQVSELLHRCRDIKIQTYQFTADF